MYPLKASPPYVGERDFRLNYHILNAKGALKHIRGDFFFATKWKNIKVFNMQDTALMFLFYTISIILIKIIKVFSSVE